ncbi:MAG: hypothetical protein ACOX4I_04720 [Anaerovoracaceae bacterium]|jgi:multimeric flavodoxin WrbA
MKVIIHDLDAVSEETLRNRGDRLIRADGKYAACQGCFSCWTGHPAECRLHDRLQYVCRTVGQADDLVIITENCYGTYSPRVKAVLDRSIGLSTPLSTYRGGQMHHTLRYGRHDSLRVFIYGDILEQEKSTFEKLVARNAVNFGFQNSQTTFLTDLRQLAGMV